VTKIGDAKPYRDELFEEVQTLKKALLEKKPEAPQLPDLGKRLGRVEEQMEEVLVAIELFKTYGFQPKQYEALMNEIKQTQIQASKQVQLPQIAEASVFDKL